MVSLTNKQIYYFFFFQAGSRAFQLPSASECISLTPWPRHSFKQSWVDHRLPVLRRCHSAAGLCQNADIPLSWERRDSGQNPCSRPSENFISDFFFFFFDSSLCEGSLWLLTQELCLVSGTAHWAANGLSSWWEPQPFSPGWNLL